jgi:VWFA-related protein
MDVPIQRVRASGCICRLVLLACLSMPGLTAAAGVQSGSAPPAQETTSPKQSSAQPVQEAAPGPASQASDKNAPEVTASDTAATFKVNVKLVLVRVVVRDSQGRAIGNLHKEDFQLFDNRKPQVISHFAMEQPGSQVAAARKTSEAAPGEKPSGAPVSLPERFIAYLFDDLHTNLTDLAVVKKAAERHFDSLQPTDRAAIFSTSGHVTLDFTDDRERLRETLRRIQVHPLSNTGMTECPDISFYMADLIQNKHDDQAFNAATQDALQCAFQNNPRMLTAAQALAQSTAARQLSLGDSETQFSVQALKDTVRRISAMPGQRSVILVSPGFLIADFVQDESDLMEHAIHSNVVIGTLDARGLYTTGPDASQGGTTNAFVAGVKTQYQIQSASADSDILAELAYGTGGAFFHNNNDLDEGFRRVAAAPEYFYMLGFAPQNLKLDGHYHNLKVTLKGQEKFVIQARRGYYAPRHAADAAEEAKQEIEDALFSQEELHDLPVELHTQYFKSSDVDAKLAVLVRVDVRRMHFRKLEGRNRNVLTVVSGLFDRNGNYITGTEKIVTMRLLDETLERKLGSGITLKSSFDVKPGSYMVRLVVRDAEGMLSAQNGAIEIP